MRRTWQLALLLALILSHSVMAFQEEVPVAWINDEPINSGEFLYAFNKNRNKDIPSNYDSLRKYLDQYLNFKLKVLAARQAGIGTTQKFKQEFEAYTSEIRKPYLGSPNIEQDLIQEAYERLQMEVRAAHILVRTPKNPTPKDTLNAYNQIKAVHEKALNGEDFSLLAQKNSQDGSARSGGDLGYFTGLTMVYPFESAAFNTAKGEVSDIVRTQFGYHIVKVMDKRPARGRVKTAHIFVNASGRGMDKAKELIQQAYDSLLNGGDWRALCTTYSEDPRSKNSGGSLPFYGVGQFPEPLLQAGFALENPGDYSKPVQSQFGWHIIKLEAKEPLKSLDQLLSTITDRVRRSGRNQLSKEDLLKKLRSENGFTQNREAIDLVVAKLSQTDSISDELPDQVLFEIGNKVVSNASFVDFTKAKTGAVSGLKEQQVWSLYQQFEHDEIIAYEESLMSQKYPEHQYLTNEYRDGLLLFEIMEQRVWNRALEDSVGLERYFEENQKQYPANERAEVLIIESDSSALLKRTIQVIQPLTSEDEMHTLLKEQLGEEAYGLLKIVKRRFEQGDLSIFAGNGWKSGGIVEDLDNSKVYLMMKIIPAGFYELNEIKGLVISDYQDFLDKEWVTQLRKNNRIKVNKRGLKALAQKLE